MRDLDDLLDDQVSRAATRSATTPPFEEIRAHGQRRRRRHRVATVLGTAVAVSVGVVGVQLADVTPDAPPIDVLQPSPPATPGHGPGPTAKQIVEDPDAQLRQLVVSPEDPGTRAAVWQVCVDAACRRRRTAVTVTGDGFENRSDLVVPGQNYPVVTAVGLDAFYVAWGARRMIIHTDGSTVPVRLTDAPGRLVDGEAVARFDSRSKPFVGFDPETGSAHRITTPPDINSLALGDDGTLRGVSYSGRTRTATAVWSGDGGDSWHEHQLPSRGPSLFHLVEGGGPESMTILAGSDGATLFPFEELHRSRDGGRTWEVVDVRTEPQAYAGGEAVLPDGRLLVNVMAWSDQRANRPSSRPVGLYISEGDDWARLSPAEVGAPFVVGDSEKSNLELLGFSAAATGTSVYAVDRSGDPGEVFRSRDGGATWEPLRAR